MAGIRKVTPQQAPQYTHRIFCKAHMGTTGLQACMLSTEASLKRPSIQC